MSIYNTLVGGFYGLSNMTWKSWQANRSGLYAAATFTIDASTTDGDLILIAASSYNSTSSYPADLTISGYTNVPSSIAIASSTGERMCFLYKIATAADAGSTITINNGNYINQGGAFVFRGNKPISSISTGPTVSSVSSGTPSPITIASSAGAPNGCVMVFTYFQGGATITNATFNPTQDGYNDIFSSRNLVYYKTFGWGDTRQDVVASMGDFGSTNVMYGFYMNLS